MYCGISVTSFGIMSVASTKMNRKLRLAPQAGETKGDKRVGYDLGQHHHMAK